MTDKPVVHFSYKDLEAEDDAPEPFVYTTNKSKRVTFPDIFGLEADEAEKFLNDMETMPDSEVLQKWLPKKDYDALKEDKLSWRRQKNLVSRVLSYYSGITGEPGEDTGSANS